MKNSVFKNFLFWWTSEGLGKKTTEDVYDSLSTDSVYDDTIDYQDRLQSLKRVVNDLKGNYKSALDLACGTGVFIEAINPEKFERIVGVDLSDGMLTVAKKRLAKYKNITFIKSSFMDIDFAEKEFDLILMSNASRFIAKDREDEFFTKVKIWLKDDGVFLIQGDYVRSDKFMNYFEPTVKKFLSKRNYNFNTLTAQGLELCLSKHFEIFDEVELTHRRRYVAKHRMFFCRKKTYLVKTTALGKLLPGPTT